MLSLRDFPSHNLCHKLHVCSELFNCSLFLIAGEDFIVPAANELKLEFRAGEECQCVTFEIVDDEMLEQTENFYVDLVSEFPEIETDTCEVVIEDDDGSKTVLSLSLSLSLTHTHTHTHTHTIYT